MFKLGYPGHDSDSISKLYDSVVWADKEIKNLFASYPLQMREVDETERERLVVDSFPVGLMPAMILVCTAHKVSLDSRQSAEFIFDLTFLLDLNCTPSLPTFGLPR